MGTQVRTAHVVMLLLPLAAAAQVPRVNVDTSEAALADLGRQYIPLCEAWYPKITALLYPPGEAPPAPSEIRIEFKQFDDPRVGAFTQNNVMQFSASDAPRRAALPYEAVVIHELTHVVQGVQVGPQWLYEGIADYIAYTLYLRTSQPFLRLDAAGRPAGYDESQPFLHALQQKKISLHKAYAPRRIPAGRGYQHGYTVTAAFLDWIEQSKRPGIVRELNTAMKAHRYHPKLWRTLTGSPLESLWKEFLKASAARTQ